MDNGSIDPETLSYLRETPHQVLRDDSPFHYPRLVNLGARGGDSDFVLLLNNDVEVLEPDWLQQLVRAALVPGVGVVGAILANSDGSIGHCGVAVPTEPLQVHFPATYPSDDRFLHSTHDSLSVLGACQLVHRELWDQLGGHDEVFQIECTDVDLSLRARELGYRTVVTANTTLLHHGKMSRGEASHADVDEFSYRWGVGTGFVDPYYTPLISFEPGPRFQRVDDAP